MDKISLPFVSLIIPCYNEEKFIAQCLDSIIGQTYPKEKLEVLVIDGMSIDGTRAILKNYIVKYPFIRLLENRKKISPLGLNIGIKNAKGELIAIGSAHCRYDERAISESVKYGLEYNADNFGGREIVLPGCGTFISKAIALIYAHSFGNGNAYYRKKTNAEKPLLVDDVVDSPFYKKEVFSHIGLFNENLVRNQDIELNLRLRKAGGKVLFIPSSITYYFARPNLRQFFSQNFWSGFWICYSNKFTKMAFYPRHLVPGVFVVSLFSTLIAALFYKPFIYIFLMITASYFTANIIFSLEISLKQQIKYFPFLMMSFLTLHLAYALGFLWGALKLSQAKSRYLFKRSLDFVLALFGTIIFSPLYIIIPLGIYLEDGRPVFFLQERIGKNAEPFRLIKFRTMTYIERPYADIDLLKDDARVTKIGRILRATAMDELPQLINILKGQMSFVGPKPLLSTIEDAEFVRYRYLNEVPGYAERIKVLPGLTGIAQIYTPKDSSRQEKFAYDIDYIKRQSLLLDIRLLLVSFFITLKARWESRGKKI